MKFLVHAHVYYKELWDELASCIANFLPDADVCITTPHADDELKQRILKKFPTARYKVVENRGYDIAPFFRVLSAIDLTKYDYVVKLHTKRNVWTWLNCIPMPAGRWRRCLLHFCVTHGNIERCLSLFESDDRIGMVCGNYALILEDDESGVTNGLVEQATKIVRLVGLPECRRQFVAGSMFIARAEVLNEISNFADMQFEATNQTIHNGTLAHACERAIGYAVCARGFKIVDIYNNTRIYAFIRPMIKVMFVSVQHLYRGTLKPILKQSMFYR